MYFIPNARAFILLLAIVIFGCSGNPKITVVNRSGSLLSNVILSGSDFSESIGTMLPDSEQKLSVSPRGESGVRLQFDVSGKHFDTGEQGYFEGNSKYRVAVTIEPSLNVTVSSDLEKY